MLSRLFSFFFFFFFWLVNKFYAFLNFRRRVNESRALESNLLIIICGDSLARNFLGETHVDGGGRENGGDVACIVVIIL